MIQFCSSKEDTLFYQRNHLLKHTDIIYAGVIYSLRNQIKDVVTTIIK